MTPADKAAARDKIAALRMRWERAVDAWGGLAPQERHAAGKVYLAALESLCDELTRPEPEEMRYDRDECIVCNCALVRSDAPPHCLDCVPTDEHLNAWESRASARRILGMVKPGP